MYDVEDVLYSRPRAVGQRRDGTTLVYGQTSAGRYLTVVITEVLDGGICIVTARNMTNTERRTFRQKGR